MKVQNKDQAGNSHRKTDRRILRTRDTLGDALVALMQEKSFDHITVQDLLDRAGVGRSTFYVHYRQEWMEHWNRAEFPGGLAGASRSKTDVSDRSSDRKAVQVRAHAEISSTAI